MQATDGVGRGGVEIARRVAAFATACVSSARAMLKMLMSPVSGRQCSRACRIKESHSFKLVINLSIGGFFLENRGVDLPLLMGQSAHIEMNLPQPSQPLQRPRSGWRWRLSSVDHALRHFVQGVVRWRSLLSRIVAALLGGYGLAALFSIAVLALPIARSEAVLWGMQLAFLVYVGAVVWVFAVRSAMRAWVGLAIAGLAMLPFAAWVWSWRAGAAAAALGAHAISGGIVA